MNQFIFGNWKMAQTKAGLEAFVQAAWSQPKPGVVTAIFPSFVHLSIVRERLPSWIAVGAQDCSREVSGAFTGEISASSLKELECEYVLIGHSERRQRAGETDVQLRSKIDRVLEARMSPVLCIGETLEQRNAGEWQRVLTDQLSLVRGLKLIVAYEPVWAIGTGRVATEDEILSAHGFLRDLLGEGIPLLYGGSVNGDNAAAILNLKNVNGVLVGGASLKAESFQRILAG